MIDVLIGIDGGGSKTLALLANVQGVVLGRGVGGASNYQSAGVEAAYAALNEAIQNAWKSAAENGLDVDQAFLRALCLGLGGVDRPADRAVIQTWAEIHYPGVPVEITNDGWLALAAGTPGGWGIAVISGTGSIVLARDIEGHFNRAGGWGYLIGDEGSGYAIGIAALRAVSQAVDGSGSQTGLLAAVLRFWDLERPQNIIHKIYRPVVPRAEIARLSMVVEEQASQGDVLAIRILDAAGEELAAIAGAAVRSVGLQGDIPCALAGSVLTKGKWLQSRFLLGVANLGVNLSPVTVVDEPAQGALRLAQRLLQRG